MPGLRTSKPSGALSDVGAVCAISVAAPSAEPQIAATDSEISRALRVAMFTSPGRSISAASRCSNDFDAVCHVASPQIPHLSPTKYPLPLALVSFISCHLSHATAATPNGAPVSWLYVPPCPTDGWTP